MRTETIAVTSVFTHISNSDEHNCSKLAKLNLSKIDKYVIFIYTENGIQPVFFYYLLYSTYRRSKKTSPINSNTNYRREMKLVPVNMDCCLL